MMNVKYMLLVLVSLLVSCEERNVDRYERKLETKEDGLLNEPDITSFTKRMTIDKLIKSNLVVDTIFFQEDKVVFNKIIGTSMKSNRKRTAIYPFVRKDTLISAFEYDDSTKLIGFHLGGDMETMIFTKWNIIDSNEIEYVNYIRTSLDSKYSIPRIIERLNYGELEYLIGKTNGGEGGDNWETLWIALFDKNENFKIMYERSTGYDIDSGDYSKIDYEVDDREIRIVEIRDYLELVNDEWKKIETSKKQLGKYLIK